MNTELPDLLSLSNISQLINELDNHQVEVKIDELTRDFDYIGNKTIGVNLDIELIGLKKGLEEIYNAL